MSKIVAIDFLGNERATLVTAEVAPPALIQILKVESLDLSQFHLSSLIPNDIPIANGSNQENQIQDVLVESSDNNSLSDASSDKELVQDEYHENPASDSDLPSSNPPAKEPSLPIDIETDATLAVISGKNVLYNHVSLPFGDQRKVDQVAPLQIQDNLPFDIDTFVVDNLILGREDRGEYSIMASLIPEQDIENTLSSLALIGSDPKLLSTKASALSNLTNCFPEQLIGSFALINLSETECSLALFVNNKLEHLRDLTLNESLENHKVARDLYTNIGLSIARVERDKELKFEHIFIIADNLSFESAQQYIQRPLTRLDLSSVAQINSEDIKINSIAWAIGLFISERSKKRPGDSKLVDFRRGRFAYKSALRIITSAVKDEFVYIILAVVMCLGWLVTKTITANQALEAVQSAISAQVKQVVSDSVPENQELSYLENKVSDLEEQLRGVGSLSSLSPLQTLQELSKTIGKNIDVEIDSLKIGHSRLTFRGTVPDLPTTGTLERVLQEQKKRFCEVNVQPGDKDPGSSRSRFTAEIKLCE